MGKYRVVDISWISDYPDEKEYLIFDHDVEIESVVLSSDYDRHYHYYHSVLEKNDRIARTQAPSGHISYESQNRIFEHLSYSALCNTRDGSPVDYNTMQWMVDIAVHGLQQMSPELR